jgi:hypothetical protein
VKSKSIAIPLAGLTLLVGGAALQPIKAGLGQTPGEPAQPAVVNGYRTFAADCLWLQTNLAWETKDEGRVRNLIDFTVTADSQTP